MATIEELEAQVAGYKTRVTELNTESAGHRHNASAARAEVETAATLYAAEKTNAAAALAAATKEHGDKLTAAEKRVTDADERVANTLKDSALRIAAKDAGIVDLDGLKLLDTSGVKVGDDGAVTIPDKFFETAKTAKPWLFAATGSSAGNTSNTVRSPPPADNKGGHVKTMTDAEYKAARAAAVA